MPEDKQNMHVNRSTFLLHNSQLFLLVHEILAFPLTGHLHHHRHHHHHLINASSKLDEIHTYLYLTHYKIGQVFPSSTKK